MSRICFLDNDIILKLTACDLFNEAISILNVNRDNIRVLPSARYYFKKSRRAKKLYPENIRNKVTTIASRYQTIEIETKEALQKINKLQSYEGIDDGEANLIAATREINAFWLTTGDKRFLKTVASYNELATIKSRLQGKVICLEQLILQLICIRGFEFILPKVLLATQYDAALKAIFGSQELSTENNVLNALDSYIKDLNTSTKDILRKF